MKTATTETQSYFEYGQTVPGIGRHPWLTRSNEEARRDNWANFGGGCGLARFVWKNDRFSGVPQFDVIASPRTYQVNASGCGTPGSLRYVGEWTCPPNLGKGLFFVVSLPRNREVEETVGAASLYLDNQLVAGHEPLPEGDGEKAPWEMPLVAEKLQWGKVREGQEAWVEVLSQPLDLEESRPYRIRIDYAAPEGGPNHFAVKICKYHVVEGVHLGEIFPPDLCFPDHIDAFPRVIRKGEKALLTWRTTANGSVTLDGRKVPAGGNWEVSPETSTTYEFRVGEQLTPITVKVL